MPELVITRHNELVDPFLRVWSWQIPVYLFLGGWVAGMMIITGVALYRGGQRERSCVCGTLPTLSVVLLSVGMLALFLDLEHKAYVWRLYTAFQIASPMSWGAWILLLVYPALLGAWLVRLPSFLVELAGVTPVGSDLGRIVRLSHVIARRRMFVQAIAVANIGLGIALGVYTGVLLSSLGGRPFWSSALLGPLFLVSGLSSAAAFAHLVARAAQERALLAKSDNLLLATELVLVGLFLVGLLGSSQAHAMAAGLVLGGPFTGVFWVGVVALGIVFPLAVQLLAASHRIQHTLVGPVLVLAGGLLLRFVFVAAGQASHWPRM